MRMGLPLKTLVLGLIEKDAHHLAFEFLSFVHLEGTVARQPRNNVVVTVLFGGIQHFVKLPWKLLRHHGRRGGTGGI